MVGLLGTEHRHRLVTRCGCALLLSLSLLLVGPRVAGAVSPTDELRLAFAEVNRILVDPELEGPLEERLAAIRQIVRRLFDFSEAAQLALGEQWHLRTVRERHEFVQLFTALLERAYLSRVAAAISFDGQDTVAYVGEAIAGERAVVSTTMQSRRRGTMEFDYRMASRGPRWVITDVVADGVSLIANYKAQFTRVIQTASYGELVERMRAKASLEAGAAERMLASVMIGDASLFADLLAGPGGGRLAAAEDGATLTSAGPHAGPEPERPAAPGARAPEPVAMPAATPPAMPASVPSVAPPDVADRPSVAAGPITPTAPATPPPAADGGPGLVRAPRAPVAARGGSYWIQVGAFKSLQTARQVVARLRQQNFPVREERDANLIRVRVGPLPARDQAAATLRELKSKGYRAFLVDVRH